MDHIPLEVHMGLEIKGELPDKMHCTSLSTKCLNNRLNFLPNPEGHGLVLWVFSQTLWVLRFLAFENCVVCQDRFLSLSLLSPVPHLTQECAVMKDQFQEPGRNRVCGGDVVGVFHFPFLFPLFSPALSLCSFHPSFLPYFVISPPPHFFFLSLLSRRMDKNRMLLRESLQ